MSRYMSPRELLLKADDFLFTYASAYQCIFTSQASRPLSELQFIHSLSPIVLYQM